MRFEEGREGLGEDLVKDRVASGCREESRTHCICLSSRSFPECIVGESREEEEELGEEFDIWWRWSCWRGREEEKERHCEC
jgi:hypothetical protein